MLKNCVYLNLCKVDRKLRIKRNKPEIRHFLGKRKNIFCNHKIRFIKGLNSRKSSHHNMLWICKSTLEGSHEVSLKPSQLSWWEFTRKKFNRFHQRTVTPRKIIRQYHACPMNICWNPVCICWEFARTRFKIRFYQRVVAPRKKNI